MIGQRGVPATYGGVERAVEELGAELAARGHDVVVHRRRGYGEPVGPTYRGMRVFERPAPGGAGVEAFVHSALATLETLRDPPDVVHFHALGPGLFAPLPRYLRRTAVVQTIQGMDNERAKWGSGARRILDLGAWTSARVPDATIVVSRALGEIYRERWGRSTTWLPNGVRPIPSSGRTDALDRLGLRPRRYLLFLGRFVPEKAVDVLLRAYRRLDTDVPLVLAGGSSHTDGYTATLHDLAADDERIVLPGYVFGDDKAQLLEGARAFVQPSLLEGLPIALLEAVAACLPVVASSIGPHQEVLGTDDPAVRYVPPGDEEALSEAMRWASADEGLEARVAAAGALSARVLPTYDWADIAARTEALYGEVLSRRRRR